MQHDDIQYEQTFRFNAVIRTRNPVNCPKYFQASRKQKW